MRVLRLSLPFKSGVVGLLGVLFLAACSGGDQASGPPAGGMPAPAVTVVTVQAEALPVAAELPGRTAAYLIAELRPQVTGIVEQRLFDEGAEVKAGEVLYRIDPAAYQAAYDSARAQLARAEANLELARLKEARQADLVERELVSRQVHDEAVAERKQAQADVAAARAAVNAAKIDLDFTAVKAPIDGRIGRSSVTPGALVTANQANALATVRQLDPIYVDLTQSSTELLRLRRALDAGRLQRLTDDTVPVTLSFEDGSEYAMPGALAFSEVAVDETTGSVTLRAVFPNPRGELLPGMYVRARLAQAMQDDAIRVPHAAVSHDPRGNALVMIVDAEDKVEARVVQLSQSLGDSWVVSSGLSAGERVIVAGLQRIRPGATVQAEESGAAAAPAPASN